MGKIKVKKQEDWKYEYTCPKCGTHYVNAVPAHCGKYSGPGSGWERVIVCTNCHNIIGMASCDGVRLLKDVQEAEEKAKKQSNV